MRAVDVIENDLKYICQAISHEVKILKNKKVLLTGGGGFLGYYFIQTILYLNSGILKNSPIKLTVYDNFIRGTSSWLENIKHDANLMLIEKDVSQPFMQLEDDFDYIIHAASIASPSFYRLYPIKTMDTNVNGLRYILDYALARKNIDKPVHSILYFSTSEIYGDPTANHIPTSEDYFGYVSCTGPRACYDESKRYGETLCVNFHQQYDIPVKIVRPFNNYGPGLKITDKRVIPDFAGNILENNDVILFSDGGPTRTFCYVTDAIAGYFKVLINGHPGQAYNIGVEKPEISMADLASLMIEISKEIFDYQGQLVFQISPDKQYLKNNPQRRCPIITKAKRELGYDPQITLSEGLKRILIWYKENSYAVSA